MPEALLGRRLPSGSTRSFRWARSPTRIAKGSVATCSERSCSSPGA